jgi:hypothetical protein
VSDSSSSQPDVAAPDAPAEASDAPLEASADAPFEAAGDDAPDAVVVGVDSGPDWGDANADATDGANLADGACTPPDSFGLCSYVISDPDAAAPSPTYEATTHKLTFRMKVGSWTVVSASATATLNGVDGGMRDATLPVAVQGDNLVIDLTNTLADPSVQAVVVHQLMLVDECNHMVSVATGGSGGTYFNISIQNTPPYLTSSGCGVFA